jgi:hypothetical protein
MRYLLLLILFCLSPHVCADQIRSFSAVCGATSYKVAWLNRGHPLDNRFVLSTGDKELFVADEGGWFEVACDASAKGEPVLIFQSYCGGSACVEEKYGVIDTRTSRLILAPSKKNVANSREGQRLLGKPVPRLSGHKGWFCCAN